MDCLNIKFSSKEKADFTREARTLLITLDAQSSDPSYSFIEKELNRRSSKNYDRMWESFKSLYKTTELCTSGSTWKAKEERNKPGDMKEGDGKEQQEVKTAAESANATLEKQKSPFNPKRRRGGNSSTSRTASSFVAPLNPDKQNTLPQEKPLQVTKRGNLKKHAYDESFEEEEFISWKQTSKGTVGSLQKTLRPDIEEEIEETESAISYTQEIKHKHQETSRNDSQEELLAPFFFILFLSK